jgi:hypothetical protein
VGLSERVQRFPRWLLLGAVLAVAAAMGAVTVMAMDEEADPDVLPATALPPEEDPGLMHVHGLGVNPADDLLYAATHFGLWRVPAEGEAERVGNVFHDLMGFTVVGPDHFQASGHPILLEDLPPLLGLIESVDGGLTWRSVSLMGAADLHALEVAHGRVYGWNSTTGQFMVSPDGQEWEIRSEVSMSDVAVDPSEADVVLATVSESFDDARLTRSTDGGRTWVEMEAPPISLLSWEAADRLWGAGIDGRVWKSSDGGQRWEPAGQLDGRPEALLGHGGILYAATAGGILESHDDGQTWRHRHVIE